MLKYFETTGFKNFEKTVSLNFSDIRDYKFNTNCIKDNLLNTAIIYGKNSIGKSNFGLALFDIVTHLTNKNISPGLYDYYLNTNNTTNQAEFKYIFQFGQDEIEYRYNKDEDQSLTYEYVGINSKLFMEYDYLSKSGNLEELKILAPTLNWVFQSEDSILKYFLNNSILNNNHPLRQMMWFVSNMLWFRSLDENRYIGYKSKSTDYVDFIFESNNLKELEGFLHKAGIEEKLVVKENNDGIKRLYFNTKKPVPFLRLHQVGQKHYTHFFTGIRHQKIFHYYLLMILMHFIIMNCLKT